MGYGSRAIQLLQEYYEGKMIDIAEKSEFSTEEIESFVQDDELNILEERIGKICTSFVQILELFWLRD